MILIGWLGLAGWLETAYKHIGVYTYLNTLQK